MYNPAQRLDDSKKGGDLPRKISEDQTRKEMIDPQLERAGWYLRDHSKVKTEIPVDGYDAEPWNGVSDYCLYRENGEMPVLGLVEGLIEACNLIDQMKIAEQNVTSPPAPLPQERGVCSLPFRGGVERAV